MFADLNSPKKGFSARVLSNLQRYRRTQELNRKVVKCKKGRKAAKKNYDVVHGRRKTKWHNMWCRRETWCVALLFTFSCSKNWSSIANNIFMNLRVRKVKKNYQTCQNLSSNKLSDKQCFRILWMRIHIHDHQFMLNLDQKLNVGSENL